MISKQEDAEKQKIINYFKSHKLSLNKVLSNIFNQKIKRITYLGSCKLRKMPEYNFNIVKFNVVIEDFSNYTIFIRIINSCQIEESLFCYWIFCDENYSLDTKFYAPKANIINYNLQKYEKRYEMKLFKRNNKIWKSSFVDIINVKKYCKSKLKNIENAKMLETNEYLFIAIL